MSSVLILAGLGALVIGGVIAWRNVRNGRGDRSASLRLAIFIFLVALPVVFFLHHHGERVLSEAWGSFTDQIGLCLFFGALAWIMYKAVEPSPGVTGPSFWSPGYA